MILVVCLLFPVVVPRVNSLSDPQILIPQRVNLIGHIPDPVKQGSMQRHLTVWKVTDKTGFLGSGVRDRQPLHNSPIIAFSSND